MYKYVDDGWKENTIWIVKLIIELVDITNSDGSVFFNGLSFVEKCAFSFENTFYH